MRRRRWSRGHTQPDEAARGFLDSHVVPVRFNAIEEPEVEAGSSSGWTPTLFVKSTDGREHRRSQGYLDVRRLIGELSLARVVAALDGHECEAAVGLVEEVVENTAGDPHREPEATYWKAVAAFEVSGVGRISQEGGSRSSTGSPRASG